MRPCAPVYKHLLKSMCTCTNSVAEVNMMHSIGAVKGIFSIAVHPPETPSHPVGDEAASRPHLPSSFLLPNPANINLSCKPMLAPVSCMQF